MRKIENSRGEWPRVGEGGRGCGKSRGYVGAQGHALGRRRASRPEQARNERLQRGEHVGAEGRWRGRERLSPGGEGREGEA